MPQHIIIINIIIRWRQVIPINQDESNNSMRVTTAAQAAPAASAKRRGDAKKKNNNKNNVVTIRSKVDGPVHHWREVKPRLASISSWTFFHQVSSRKNLENFCLGKVPSFVCAGWLSSPSIATYLK
jgi:hypothetical protein